MAEKERKSSSLTSQSIWILVAKVTGFALNTMLPLLIVRYLSQDNVGVYRQAFMVASNAVLVLPLGFSMSAFYFLNREPEKHPAAVFNILLFNFGMGALAFLVLFFFPGLLGAAFQNSELTRLAPLIGVVIWLWIFSGFLETAALSLQEARLAAAFIVFSQLLKTLLMTLGVLMYQSVDSLVYAAILLFSMQSVVLVGFLHRRFPNFWKSFDLAFFRRQFTYALPFGLSVLLYVCQTDIHNYFVSHSFTAAEFAIYSVGCFQLPLIAMLYESVGSVLIPRVSQLQAENKKRETLELSVNATQKLAFFYFPLFCYLMIVAGEFIATLFTSEYAASASIFRVNLFALPLFSLVADPVTRAFPIAGKFLLKVRIVICIVLVAIFWYGLGRLGLLDMIAIVVGAVLFEKLMSAWISVRMLDAKPGDIVMLKTIGKIAASAAAAGVVLFAFYLLAADGLLSTGIDLSRRILLLFDISRGSEFFGGCIFLGVCMLIYGTAYLLIANLLGAIEPEDKEKFGRLVRKVIPGRAAETKAAL